MTSPVVLQYVGQPVGHCDDGGLVQQLQQQLLYLVLPGGVQTAGGLVQDQNPRLTEDAPGQSDELPGGGSEDPLAVLHHGVQPTGQLSDLHLPQHLPELLLREPAGGVQAEPDRPADQPGLLVDQTRAGQYEILLWTVTLDSPDELPELDQRPLRDLYAVDTDPTLQ